MSPSRLLTVREVSDRLRISLASVYSLIKVGVLTSMRVGSKCGAIRVREEDLTTYLDASIQSVSASVPKAHSVKTSLKHIRLK